MGEWDLTKYGRKSSPLLFPQNQPVSLDNALSSPSLSVSRG